MAIFCLFANCHNLLLTKSQTAKVCMLKGQLAFAAQQQQQHVKDFFATNLSRVQILIPLWVWKKPRDQHAEGPGG